MNSDTVTVDTIEPDNGSFSVNDIIDGTLDHLANLEVENLDAVVTIAVDNALRRVVEFLYERGQNGTADFLEMEIEQDELS